MKLGRFTQNQCSSLKNEKKGLKNENKRTSKPEDKFVSQKKEKNIINKSDIQKLKSKTKEKDEKEVTFLFYMNGEYKDIGKQVQSSLNSLEQSGSDENVNLVVELGFTPEKTRSKKNPVKYDVRRYYINKQDNDANMITASPKDVKSKPLYHLPSDKSISQSKNLQNFVSWGMKKYPAKNYALVLMGHGGAFMGALDQKPADMATAVKKGVELANKATGKNEKLDIMFFNSCIMANLEAMAELRDTAEYYIASQEVAFSGMFSGWKLIIDGVKKSLNEGENFDPRAFSKDMVKLYDSINKEAEKEEDPFAKLVMGHMFKTLSVIENKGLSPLIKSYSGLLKTMRDEKIPPNKLFQAMKKSENVLHYSKAVGGEYNFTYHLKDLGNLMSNILKSDWATKKVKTSAKKVKRALKKAVVKEQSSGVPDKDLQGLTIWAPHHAGHINHMTDKYQDLTPNFNKETGWADLLEKSAGKVPVGIQKEYVSMTEKDKLKGELQKYTSKKHVIKFLQNNIKIYKKDISDYKKLLKKLDDAKEIKQFESLVNVKEGLINKYKEKLKKIKEELPGMKEEYDKVLGKMKQMDKNYFDLSKKKNVNDPGTGQ
ncbi:MAG: hypothetical protein K8T10_15270 [Candidatus Eremiobacteraeota bacterium]|nr:hypothetical protein [Candidatus Eremiobacteraeota bacterium]